MWTVQYRIFRYRQEWERPRYESFLVEADPDQTVLDGLEKIWAFQDRSLTFRHACHHASCGSCGIRVNGMERLPCVFPIREATKDGGTVTCEPLRGFPLVSDLVVDMGQLFHSLEELPFTIIRSSESRERVQARRPGDRRRQPSRFENCIECGLCVSACPIAGSDDRYLGPAVLAAACRMLDEPRRSDPERIVRIVDQEHGCWRCHAAFECSEVCPSNVDPAKAIMTLRRDLTWRRIRRQIRRS